MTALGARASTRRRRRPAPQSGNRAAPVALAGALLILLCSPACALRGQDEDWYKVLGVPRTAESSVIRSAYRKLVLRWHPGAISPRCAARALCAPGYFPPRPPRARACSPCPRAPGNVKNGSGAVHACKEALTGRCARRSRRRQKSGQGGGVGETDVAPKQRLRNPHESNGAPGL